MTAPADAPALLARGFALQQQGNIVAAERIYEQILAKDPAQFDALHFLGVAAYQTGRIARGVELIGRAVAASPPGWANPNLPTAQGNLAFGLLELGRAEEALRVYDDALARSPNHAEFHFGRGVALQRLERHEAALGAYDRAVALQPGHAGAHGNRGGALLALGRHGEAEASLARAVALQPGNAEAHRRRGDALQLLRRYGEAITSYNAAVARRPDDAEAHANRGNVLHKLGLHEEAVAAYGRAIALRPEDATAYSNRSAPLYASKRHMEALASCDRALALRPDYAEARANRAKPLQALRRYGEALASLDQAVELRRDDAATHSARGAALQEMGRYEDALAGFRQAVTLAPDYADAHLNEGVLLLLLGRFEEGWRQYEWRKRLDEPSGRRTYPKPEWLGGEDIAGRTLFLHWEQGFGDTIQFCRYAKLVRAMGARVVLSMQDRLVRLLGQLDPDITVIGEAVVPERFDFHCPLLSLPLALGTTLDTIPAEPRYLEADPALAAGWLARLPEGGRPRVGLVWSGRPTHRNDHNRSIPLDTLAPLLAAEVDWVAPQTDLPPADAEALRHDGRIGWVGGDLVDFADTAALLECLDLVITVDTSLAHLAGAMGKPTWVLLPASPDWRWLLDRRDTPWYPSARLFRQSEAGDWSAVVREVRDHLDVFVGRHRAPV